MMEPVVWLMQQAVAVQRQIYETVGERVNIFAETGDWQQLAVFLPAAILFGAIHALTPGHSKIVLATYAAGSPVRLLQAVGISLLLSFVHISMAVAIAWFSLPLISLTLGSAGEAPLLQDVSRGMLGVVGLWMIWQAFRMGTGHQHIGARSGIFAVFSGLIPCPLTLFVMTYAMGKSVASAGLVFAVFMMAGVALTLAATATASVLLRSSMMRLLSERTWAFHAAAKALQSVAGLILVLVALNELLD